MALQTIVSGLLIPPLHNVDTFTISTLAIDATGEAAACLFRVPVGGKINALSVRFGAVTTGDTISIEAQTVTTASGLPSDTLWATGTAMSFSLTTTMANSWQTINLSAVATVTIGDVVALAIKRDDVGGAGNFTVARLAGGMVMQGQAAAKVLAAWARTAGSMCVIPHYSGVAQPAALENYSPYTSLALSASAGSNPDELGNLMNFPFLVRATGFYVLGQAAATGGIFKVRLYDTDGTTVMTSRTLDMDVERPLGGGLGLMQGHFLSATVLAINSNYRLSIFASAGTVTMLRLSAPAASAIARLALGSACYATTRTDSGAWSNDTTSMFGMGLIVDQLDDSSASGGAASGLAHIIGGP